LNSMDVETISMRSNSGMTKVISSYVLKSQQCNMLVMITHRDDWSSLSTPWRIKPLSHWEFYLWSIFVNDTTILPVNGMC
jgi:hypothetical protein